MRVSQAKQGSFYACLLASIICIFCFISPALAEEGVFSAQGLEKIPLSYLSQQPWAKMKFTDITGEEKSVLELSKQGPVVLHLFTIWCTSCSRQLTESTRLIEEQNEAITVISLDIDPMENGADIAAHVSKNGYKGVFAVVPADLTLSLANEFGSTITTSIPQTVVIGDQSAKYVGSGVVSKDRIMKALTPSDN
jgi:thiol:disulfide interchange protein